MNSKFMYKDITLQYDYYYEIRDNRALFIFPEKPFWFVSDVSVCKVMEYF